MCRCSHRTLIAQQQETVLFPRSLPEALAAAWVSDSAACRPGEHESTQYTRKHPCCRIQPLHWKGWCARAQRSDSWCCQSCPTWWGHGPCARCCGPFQISTLHSHQFVREVTLQQLQKIHSHLLEVNKAFRGDVIHTTGNVILHARDHQIIGFRDPESCGGSWLTLTGPEGSIWHYSEPYCCQCSSHRDQNTSWLN